MNLSALFFLLFPILGILIPYIIWHSKKGRITKLDEAGSALINFQITWNLLLFSGILFIGALLIFGAPNTSFALLIGSASIFIFGAYVYNFILILINTSLIQKGKPLNYIPRIKFL